MTIGTAIAIGFIALVTAFAAWAVWPRRGNEPSAKNNWRQRGISPTGMAIGLGVDAADSAASTSDGGGDSNA